MNGFVCPIPENRDLCQVITYSPKNGDAVVASQPSSPKLSMPAAAKAKAPPAEAASVVAPPAPAPAAAVALPPAAVTWLHLSSPSRMFPSIVSSNDF